MAIKDPPAISFNQWLVILGMLMTIGASWVSMNIKQEANYQQIESLKIELKVYREQNWNDHRDMYLNYKNELKLLRDDMKEYQNKNDANYSVIKETIDRNFRGINRLKATHAYGQL